MCLELSSAELFDLVIERNTRGAGEASNWWFCDCVYLSFLGGEFVVTVSLWDCGINVQAASTAVLVRAHT